MSPLEARLEVWKTTIEVQKHFNELEMRIRGVALTILAAFLAAAGYTMKENLRLELLGGNISLTVLVLIGAAVCWISFYLMDRFWYHRLLKGAVQHGLTIEAALQTEVPEIGLTSAIGAASPFKIGRWKVGSDRKMDLFCGAILALLLFSALGSLLNTAPQRAAADQAVQVGKPA